jgi:hypothetical protein
MRRFAAVVLPLTVALVAGCAAGDSTTPATTPANLPAVAQPQPAPVPDPPPDSDEKGPLILTSSDNTLRIQSDYYNSPTAFNRKYKGRTIEISVTGVRRVSKKENGDVVAEVSGTWKGGNIHCHFGPKFADRLEKVQPGDAPKFLRTVRGRFDGFNSDLVTGLILRDCELLGGP